MSEKKLSYPELSAFAGQMSLILKAGISAIEGITIMRDDAESEEDKKLLTRILDDYSQTGQLCSALQDTGLFPNYMVQMVRIGEQTGNLDTVMDALDRHYSREEDIRVSTSNSVLYPLILTGVMIAVVLVLMVRVMPVFQQVFSELGAEMTGLPLLLLRIGNGIRTYSVSALLILASVLILVFVSNKTRQGRDFWYRFGRHFKSVRKSHAQTASCRFASAMSMALASGLTPGQGLDLVMDLNEDPDFAARLTEVKKDTDAGDSFAESLYQHKVFTGLYARMISLGAKTGTMDKVLSQIADLCQDEIDSRLNSRLAAIEPVFVIILSAVVGAILLSVMFPLLGIMSSL